MAENQLKGSGNLTEMLSALTDDELDEQILYFRERITTASELGRWKLSSMLTSATEIRHARTPSE